MREQRQADHKETAAAARAGGTWVHVFVYRATKTAQQIARLDGRGELAYSPAGDFEAYAATVPAVWWRA
ncbi:hypothetical protein ACH5AL_24465 [Actinacidiphila glaucinigra]|uniref:hypothetical protein n=1 Tax=Actinacidiphila glaucinigra TaxID=235986 RepID=UPI0037A25F68